MTAPQTLSVIVPAFNAAEVLPATLAVFAAAGAPPGIETVVVDAGSTDATRSVAAAAGARVVDAPRGRGPQLVSGGEAASAPWLLFVHADTRLSADWAAAVTAFMTEPDNAMRAAVCRYALDDDSPAARRLERLVAWRTRALGLPYGDQGLLISRRLYDALGGFRPLPLMEDVDMIRRIGRRRLSVLDVDAVTSAARYRRGGWWLRPMRNLFCLSLYFFGVPPRLIRRVYE